MNNLHGDGIWKDLHKRNMNVVYLLKKNKYKKLKTQKEILLHQFLSKLMSKIQFVLNELRMVEIHQNIEKIKSENKKIKNLLSFIKKL